MKLNFELAIMLTKQITILINSSKLLNQSKKEQFLSFLSAMSEGQKAILLKNLQNLKIAEENLNKLSPEEFHRQNEAYLNVVSRTYREADRKVLKVAEYLDSDADRNIVDDLDLQLQSL